jgi:hypothetical protein
MNLPFETAVAFVMPVMFANSRNVALEKAETGKRGSRLSYAPTMLIPKPETTFPANFWYFSEKGWANCEIRSYHRPKQAY